MNSCNRNPDHRSELPRAQGCFLGQLAGYVLGKLQSPEDIYRSYPDGEWELAVTEMCPLSQLLFTIQYIACNYSLLRPPSASRKVSATCAIYRCFFKILSRN